MKEAFIFTEESSISPSADNPERMAWNSGQNGDSGQGRWRMDRWKWSAKASHGRKVKAYLQISWAELIIFFVRYLN